MKGRGALPYKPLLIFGGRTAADLPAPAEAGAAQKAETSCRETANKMPSRGVCRLVIKLSIY